MSWKNRVPAAPPRQSGFEISTQLGHFLPGYFFEDLFVERGPKEAMSKDFASFYFHFSACVAINGENSTAQRFSVELSTSTPPSTMIFSKLRWETAYRT